MRPSGSLNPHEKVFLELEAIYAEADKKVPVPDAVCRRDGACCRFSTSGLKLYASSLEAAYLVLKAGPPPRPLPEGVCPYLKGNLCRAREGRALGCRVYHCDAVGGEERIECYEKFHGEIKELHERYDVEYVYEELLDHPFFPDAAGLGIPSGGRS